MSHILIRDSYNDYVYNKTTNDIKLFVVVYSANTTNIIGKELPNLSIQRILLRNLLSSRNDIDFS